MNESGIKVDNNFDDSFEEWLLGFFPMTLTMKKRLRKTYDEQIRLKDE